MGSLQSLDWWNGTVESQIVQKWDQIGHICVYALYTSEVGSLHDSEYRYTDSELVSCLLALQESHVD